MSSQKANTETSILLAESNPLYRSQVQRLLEEFQFRNVSVASDGYKALHEGKVNRYGLIILDCALSQVDGFKVLATLRDEGKNTETPIVVTYAANPEETVQKATEAGASACLKKPLEEGEFRKAVEPLLDGYLVSQKEVKGRAKTNDSATSAAVSRGRALFLKGDLDGAEAAFEEAMVTGGGTMDVFLGLADVYKAKGDEEAARMVLLEAERLDPEAMEKFRKLMRAPADPETLEAGTQKSKTSGFAPETPGEAEREEEDSPCPQPDHEEEDTVFVAESPEEDGGQDSEILEAGARKPSRMKDGSEGTGEPSHVAPAQSDHCSKGREYLRQERFEDALEAFEAAARADRQNVEALVGLCRARHSLGDCEGANIAFEEAMLVPKSREHVPSFNQLGIHLRRNKDYVRALRAFDRAVACDSQDAVLYYNKSLVYIAQRQLQVAMALLKICISLDPDFEEAKRAIDRVKDWMAQMEEEESAAMGAVSS